MSTGAAISRQPVNINPRRHLQVAGQPACARAGSQSAGGPTAEGAQPFACAAPAGRLAQPAAHPLAARTGQLLRPARTRVGRQPLRQNQFRAVGHRAPARIARPLGQPAGAAAPLPLAAHPHCAQSVRQPHRQRVQGQLVQVVRSAHARPVRERTQHRRARRPQQKHQAGGFAHRRQQFGGPGRRADRRAAFPLRSQRVRQSAPALRLRPPAW